MNRFLTANQYVTGHLVVVEGENKRTGEEVDRETV